MDLNAVINFLAENNVKNIEFHREDDGSITHVTITERNGAKTEHRSKSYRSWSCDSDDVPCQSS
jgi:hypothetical protein